MSSAKWPTLGQHALGMPQGYIDPCVFEGWRAGQLQAMAAGVRGERQWEAATLKFLTASRSKLKAQATPASKRKSA